MANPTTAITIATMSANLAGDGVSTIGGTGEPGFWSGEPVYLKSDFDLTQAGGGGEGIPGQPAYAVLGIFLRQINVAGVTNFSNKAGTAATSATQDGPTAPYKLIIQRVTEAGTLIGKASEVHVDDVYTLATLQAAVTGAPVSTWTNPTPPEVTYVTPIPGVTFLS